jgi:hypothetical protein
MIPAYTIPGLQFSTKVKKASKLRHLSLSQLLNQHTYHYTGWKCCKPRVLTFDEFLEIPPCTTGKHSTVDDTPVQPKPAVPAADEALPPPAPRLAVNTDRAIIAPLKPAASPAPAPETEDDDPSLEIPNGKTCRRKGCKSSYDPMKGREGETCVHHPGRPVFHEGTKGWTCCKRRVLDFDEFLGIEGCQTKERHLFVGKGKSQTEEEKLDSVKLGFKLIKWMVLTFLGRIITRIRHSYMLHCI